MKMYDIIEKKRKGQILNIEDISYFIEGVVDGSVLDSQTGAMLVAICEHGMSDIELFDLCKCMVESGNILDLSGIEGVIADKHSSGGVSDSTTLLFTAIMVALNFKIAKMSGRGLGHTGGTIDKLESFSGYDSGQSMESFIQKINACGASIISQSGELAPADKKLYAIRDITATVNSIPLIASSIMSKKIAGGAKNLVLDVKYGKGAFMQDPRSATMLAKKMVAIAKRFEINAIALVTNMNAPLGNKIGCNLEMQEVIDSLCSNEGELIGLAKIMCCKILLMTKSAENEAQAMTMIDDVINNKSAVRALENIIESHGGDIKYFSGIKFPVAEFEGEMCSDFAGEVTDINALALGKVVCDLGGGRTEKGGEIDYKVGMELLVRVGDVVEVGQVTARIFAKDEESLQNAAERVEAAITINGEKSVAPLVYATVTSDRILYDKSVISIVEKENAIMECEYKLDMVAADKYRNIRASIEHTNLTQTASKEDIRALCRDAEKNGFHAVCIQPSQIAVAKETLAVSNVKICTVVGFPYGEVSTVVKALETKEALKLGATEIDMVLCVSKLKQRDLKYVTRDISKVVKIVGKKGIVKVIIEASLLTEEEIRCAVDCIVRAGAHFVKTSTGLFGIGSTIGVLNVIRDQLNKTTNSIQIKAAGGIKTLADVESLVASGAARIGTSNSLAIVTEIEDKVGVAREKITQKVQETTI